MDENNTRGMSWLVFGSLKTGMRDPLVLVVRSWPGDSGVVGFMDVPATLIYQPLDSTKRFVMGLTSYFREIGSWA
ncbi:hypothetical protein ACOSP7_024157 [Xanthoceras sorbifolium]